MLGGHVFDQSFGLRDVAGLPWRENKPQRIAHSMDLCGQATPRAADCPRPSCQDHPACQADAAVSVPTGSLSTSTEPTTSNAPAKRSLAQISRRAGIPYVNAI
jgi:hypothetical protein